jgi:hypothetical protein
LHGVYEHVSLPGLRGQHPRKGPAHLKDVSARALEILAHARIAPARTHAQEQHPRVHTNASRGWCRFFAYKRVTARAHAREQALEFTRTHREVGAGLRAKTRHCPSTRSGTSPRVHMNTTRGWCRSSAHARRCRDQTEINDTDVSREKG